MDNITQNCSMCKYSHLVCLWKGSKAERQQYECRRHSPEMVLKNVEEDISSWPFVRPDDICGDYDKEKP